MIANAPEGKSKRGLVKHKENPFLAVASDATRTKIKRMPSASGERMMVISGETGEVMAPAGFWEGHEVDKAQFIKLYVNGVKAFKDLKGAGTKVFELLYNEMQKNIGKDQIMLVYADIDQSVTPISEATFYRGTRELIDKQFIAETVVSGRYFINPDYMWNGDRLAFVKTYRIRQSTKDTLTADMFEAPALGHTSD